MFGRGPCAEAEWALITRKRIDPKTTFLRVERIGELMRAVG
jgi:hypothetical protein